MFIYDMQVTVWNGHCPVHAEPALFDCFYGLSSQENYLQIFQILQLSFRFHHFFFATMLHRVSSSSTLGLRSPLRESLLPPFSTSAEGRRWRNLKLCLPTRGLGLVQLFKVSRPCNAPGLPLHYAALGPIVWAMVTVRQQVKPDGSLYSLARPCTSFDTKWRMKL